MKALEEMDAVAIREAVVSGRISAVEVTREALERIEKHATSLNCFLYIDAEGALAKAHQVDQKRARGEQLGPLAGVPYAAKDNMCTRGLPTTCASKILAGYVPPYDADVIERLRAADAVLVAKANMDEFAMGSSNENSAYGSVRNPWDAERTPGGSSGGSAAATAARLVAFSLGSDTGGSVRQPGAFTNLVAVKPTYGRVSRYGLVAFASSLDQIGPFATSARDAARVTQVISGHDARDATSSANPVPDLEVAARRGVNGLRVGVLRDAMNDSDPAVVRATSNALDILRRSGAEILDVTLPTAGAAVAAYYIVAPAEASSNLARFDGMRFGPRAANPDLTATYEETRGKGFGREVRRRIILGTYALSAGYYDAYYIKAQRARAVIASEYARAFEACDVIISPTTPTPPFKLGEKTNDPLAMYLSDVFTLPASLAGVAAINVPAGFADATSKTLPVGIHVAAPHFQEERLFAVAQTLEEALRTSKELPKGYVS